MPSRKSISNTFTVTTLIDGESAPYYFEEKYAWSNDSSTQSVTTPPSISGGWQTSIPPSNGYAYLWRMSIRHVWNESTRSYTQEDAQYFRMSGTNGTSIYIKGHVSTVQNLPTTHEDGDAYVVDANGHLYMWSDESGSWIDIGLFQGESGKTYYTHIAWASQVNYSGTTVTSVIGFVTDKSPNDTSHMWMGVYIDEQSGQDSTNALLYTWSYTKGVDGISVQARYAPNDNPTVSQIHTIWQSGDLYMQTKQSNETTWSSWHKIVGESGDETDYTFNISQSLTSTNATTAPANCYYNTWQDAPIAPTSSYPYLWMKIVKKTWNESTQSYNSGTAHYARVTGENAVLQEFLPSLDVISFARTEAGGLTPSSRDLSLYIKKTQGGSTSTQNIGVSGLIIRWSSTSMPVSKTGGNGWGNGTATGISWNNITMQVANTVAATNIYIAAFNSEGTLVDRVTIPVIKDGNRGKVGRFFYYAGKWNDFASTDSFLVNDAQAPYFYYNNNYWVFNPETNGTYTKQNMGTPSSSSSNWKLMTSDFKYIITEAIFGSYAHFGGAIINGDYLMSQYGYMLGFCNTKTPINDNTQYQNVDMDDVLGDDDMYDPTKLIWNDSNQREITSTTYTTITSASFVQNKYYTLEIDENTEVSGNEMLWTIVSQSGTEIAGGTIISTATGTNKNCVNFKSTVSATCYLRVKITNRNNTVDINGFYLRFAKFIPYLAMDLLSGKFVANNIIARGELHADSLYHTMVYGNSNDDRFTINDESIVNLGTNAVGTTVILPSPSSCKGRVVELFNHATRFYTTWVGAYSTSSFSAAYGSGLGIRVIDSISYKYIKFYCDGTSWWILKAEV